MKHVIVWWRNCGLALIPEIADRFNLSNGADLESEEKYLEVRRAQSELAADLGQLNAAIREDFDAEVEEGHQS